MQMLVVERKVLMWTLVLVSREMLVVVKRDAGAGEQRDAGAGEETDVGGGEEEKVGNPNNEDDNDEWFTDFSSMRKEVEVETDDHHSEELKNLISSDDEYEDVDKVYPRYNESSRVGE